MEVGGLREEEEDRQVEVVGHEKEVDPLVEGGLEVAVLEAAVLVVDPYASVHQSSEEGEEVVGEILAGVDGVGACEEGAAWERTPSEAVVDGSEEVGPWAEPCGAWPLVAWEEPSVEASFLQKKITRNVSV